ncbi:COG3740 Phage head maturation protease [Rhabdaerophilaceae bacterium]
MSHSLTSSRFPSLPSGRAFRAPARKSGSTDVSTLIEPDGQFEGYASVFGIADLGRDVVLPGAFRTSLSRRSAAGVKLLWQHDATQPLGEWNEIIEDRYGLFVSGKLDLGLLKARELHRLVARGTIDGLSIGYRTESERRDPSTGLRRLEKLDLWEISIVTFPLLPQARIAQRGAGRGINGGRA